MAKTNITPAVKSAISLAVFTIICIFFVELTHSITKDIIKENIAKVLIKNINELVSNYDNDIIKDKIIIKAMLYNNKQDITIYYAKKNNKVFSYLISYSYPNGYNGDIKLLSAISINNKIIGTRVITHKETPGLGDGIQTNKSNWIKQFNNSSLKNTSLTQWQVIKNGGKFKQLTGATITSRAVINAVYELLLYLNANKKLLHKHE